MNFPTVTIVITYHNEGTTLLNTALQSIAEQTYPGKIEVIVVDDASDSPVIIDQNYTFSVTLVRSEKNIFAPAARNLGVSHARGELISFLDADDVYLPNHTEDHALFMIRNNSCSFCGSNGYIHRSAKVWEHTPPFVTSFGNKQSNKPSVLPADFTRKMCITYGFHLCGFMVKKEKFIEVEGFNTQLAWGEEWELHIKLCQTGAVGYIPKPTYRYMSRPNSITNSPNPRKHESYASICDFIRSENTFSLTPNELRIIQKKSCEELLLAAQLYLETKYDPFKAFICSAKSLTHALTFWGLRSLVRSFLNLFHIKV